MSKIDMEFPKGANLRVDTSKNWDCPRMGGCPSFYDENHCIFMTRYTVKETRESRGVFECISRENGSLQVVDSS